MTLDGEPLAATPRASIAAGIGRIPEDRHHEGIVGALSIAENLALETLRAAVRGGFLQFDAMRERAEAAIRDYDVRCPGPDAAIRLLSGGNIQKVILARVFERNPRVVLANQPTRGLDVGADGRGAPPPARGARARRRHRADLRGSRRAARAVRPRRRDRRAAGSRRRSRSKAVTREQLGLMMAGHAEAA